MRHDIGVKVLLPNDVPSGGSTVDDVDGKQEDTGDLFEATYSQRVEFSPGLEAIELGGPGNVWLVYLGFPPLTGHFG